MTAMLVIVVCSISSPSKCHKVDLLVQSCTAGGQAAAAQWVGKQPDLYLAAIKSCEPGLPA